MPKFFIFVVLLMGCDATDLEPCGADNGYACAVRVKTQYGAAQGVVVGDRAVLTAAHVVRYDRPVVTVRTRDGGPIGRSASIVRHPTADLAIISFWEKLDLPIAELTTEPAPIGSTVYGAFRNAARGEVSGPDWRDADQLLARWTPETGRGDSGGGVFLGDELVGIHSGSLASDRAQCGGYCGYEVDLSFFVSWINETI